ncbi:MAG TPA: nucleotidyltransferase domain-containing protein [Terrimicrobiaceae bacterium]
MKAIGLAPNELTLIAGVFRRHPEVRLVKLFGSRAKGTHTPHSDVDLALWGHVDAIRAESMAAELDELPLPYRFEVQPFESIKLLPLREHIERVGITIYPVP